MEANHWTGDDNRDELGHPPPRPRGDYYQEKAERLERDLQWVMDDRDRLKRELRDLQQRNTILQERLDRLIKGDAA